MDSTIAQSDVGFVEEFARTLARVLPRAGLCVVILVLGYLAAKLLAGAVDRILGRVGFDRAVVRGGVGQVLERTRYDPSDLLAKLVFWLVLLVAAQLAFGVFGPNPVSDLITGVIAYLPNVFVAVVILVITAALAALARELVAAAVGTLAYGGTLAAVASGTVLVVGGFAAASQLRIAPDILHAVFYALLATVAGTAIVAIGGAGIVPLRARWERALTRLEEEAPQVREHARQARETRRQEAEAREREVAEAEAREREARERQAREAEALQAEARERAAREAEVREAEARDQAAREEAVRELAAREEAVREQAVREQAALEEAVREEAVREQAVREQAAREREDAVTEFLPAPGVPDGGATRRPARPRSGEPTRRLSLDDLRVQREAGAGGDPEADELTQPLRPYPDLDDPDLDGPGAAPRGRP